MRPLGVGLLVCLLAACGQPAQQPARAPATAPAELEAANAGGFTLRVILYGLIAFVPNEQGKGMTALLVKAQGHDGVLGALEDSECFAPGDACNPDKSGSLDFLWRLDKAPFKGKKLLLSIGAGQAAANSPNLDLRWGGNAPQGLPSYPEQLQGNEWIPRMRHISNAHKALNNEERCLTSLDCAAAAKVQLSFAARAGVCHFAHKDLPGDENLPWDSKCTKQKMYGLFHFKNSSPTVEPSRALADALWFEIAVPGKEVTIEARDAAKLGNPLATITLEPVDARRTVTVVVSNNNWQADTGTSVHEHFKHYYNLSLLGVPADPLLPDVVKEDQGPAPFCECQLTEFEKGVGGAADGAHNQRECDVVSLTPSSWG